MSAKSLVRARQAPFAEAQGWKFRRRTSLGCFAAAGLFGGLKVATGRADQAPLSVREFGAVGDGVSDDTAAIQRGIEYLYERGGGLLEFPNEGGRVYRCHNVGLRPGIYFRGNGSRILKTPAMGEPETELKWRRLWTTHATRQSFREGTAPIWIEGFIFDGNASNMNWSGGYEQEQGASLFLSGDPTGPGRLRAFVRDCVGPEQHRGPTGVPSHSVPGATWCRLRPKSS